MPIIQNTDNLGFWGRYLIYAREPIGFPLGTIKNLSFPFQSANITRGSIPLFAFSFKLLSKFFPFFAEFYYFPLVELVAVFAVGYYTCLILDEYKADFFLIKLLAAVLTSLSFPLLFRSSNYFGATVHVFYFPLYMAFGYYYLLLNKKVNLLSLLKLLGVFILVGLTEYYVLLALLLILIFCLGFNLWNFWLLKNQLNRQRLILTFLALILGASISSFALYLFGNQSNLESYPNISPLINRYSTKWGYGGGDGGGFHVADVFSLFIPPKDDKQLPGYKRLGPTAYLAYAGFPITTNNLQDGQYEGFTYLGSITIGILFFLIIWKLGTVIKKNQFYWVKIKLFFEYNLFKPNNLSTEITIGLATGLLYVISWGYILHIGGVRYNDISTPSLLIAMLYHNFMFARSLGRLAVPFMLYIVITLMILLNRFCQSLISKNNYFRKKLLISIVTIGLIVAHIIEIKGYLQTTPVVYGNEIRHVFGIKDQQVIGDLLINKKALMVVPEFTGELKWGKIVYALAFYGKIPVSGATIGPPGERPEDLQQFKDDIKTIRNGNIKEIVDRYGNIAIAAPSDVAKDIFKTTNIPLKYHQLNDQNVMILTLD